MLFKGEGKWENTMQELFEKIDVIEKLAFSAGATKTEIAKILSCQNLRKALSRLVNQGVLSEKEACLIEAKAAENGRKARRKMSPCEKTGLLSRSATKGCKCSPCSRLRNNARLAQQRFRAKNKNIGEDLGFPRTLAVRSREEYEAFLLAREGLRK